MKSLSKKNEAFVFLIVLLINLNCYGNALAASNNSPPPPGFRVLIVVSSGFGMTYFDAKG